MRVAASPSSTSWKAPSTPWRYSATATSYDARACSTAARRLPPVKSVSTIEGPMDQKRLGSENRPARVPLWKPAEALRRKRGKNAAVATPTCALAAATCRSAAATSGRRSSSSEGSSRGIAGDVGLEVPADTPEDVGFPGEVERHLVDGGRGRLAGAPARRAGRAGPAAPVRPRHRNAAGDGGEQVRPRPPGDRARRPVGRLRPGQVLVRLLHLLLERVEVRVAEDLPPLPARRVVAGLGGLPVLRPLAGRRGLLERGRDGGGGAGVVRPHRAAAAHQEAGGDDRPRPHQALPAAGTAARSRPRSRAHRSWRRSR